MTTKQRAYLKSLAMTMDPIFQIGKNSMTPELTKAVSEALEARELIKVSVLQNCADDPKELAAVLAERTRSRWCRSLERRSSSTKRERTRKRRSNCRRPGSCI